jgi:predicted GH43/DUF377 family glycosyl hydrolase
MKKTKNIGDHVFFKPSEIAGDRVKAYNPTLADIGGSFMLVFRYENVGTYVTSLGSVELDRETVKPISGLKDIKVTRTASKITTIDDPRFFRHKNKSFLCHCQGAEYQAYQWCSSVCIALVEANHLQCTALITPNYGGNHNWIQTGRNGELKAEKNWSYLGAWGDEMLFTYTLHPFEIIRMPVGGGITQLHCFKDWENPWGRFLGGGTSFAEWDDKHVITMFHSFVNVGGQRVYDAGFLLVDSQSWLPKYISKKPVVTGWADMDRDFRFASEPSSNYRPLVYWPSGIVPKRDHLMISFGWNDCMCGISYFSRKDIESGLVPVKLK